MSTDSAPVAIRVSRWLVIVGLGLGPVIGWLTIRLVASAWSACEDIAGGPAFGLAFGYLPAAVIALWTAFYVGAYLGRRWRTPARLVVSLALTAVTASVVVVLLVPDDSGVLTQVDRIRYPECGANAMPTWWPAWLPE